MKLCRKELHQQNADEMEALRLYLAHKLRDVTMNRLKVHPDD